MKRFLVVCILLLFFVLGFKTLASKPSDFGLKEGDLISAIFSDDPDVYIVNEHGYKRLFLNPEIFKFYTHLGGFASVKLVTPEVRDSFPTVGLFRNCEKNDLKVYGFESDNEDKGKLRWIDTSGEQAVKDDPNFFKKVFCINDQEFRWYPKGQELKSVQEVPQYSRVMPITPAIPAIPASPSQPLVLPTTIPKPASGSFTPTPTPTIIPQTATPATPAQPANSTPTPTPTSTASPSFSPTPTPTSTPAPALSSPTSLIATLGTNRITLNWSGTSTAYLIHRSVNGGTYESIFSAYSPSYLDYDGGFVSGSTYRYKVYGCEVVANVCQISTAGMESNTVTYATVTPTPAPTPTPSSNITINLSVDSQPSYPRVYIQYDANQEVAVTFEYGTTISYGKTKNVWWSSSTPQYWTSNGAYIGETYLGEYLNLNTTYHVRAKATNKSGTTVYSNDYTFYLQSSTPTPTPTPTPTTSSVSFDNFSRNLANAAKITRDLYQGTTGDDVKQLQSLLVNEVNYSANLITGYFGSITRDAVKRLQEKYGVRPASGYFGGITRRTLQALIFD